MKFVAVAVSGGRDSAALLHCTLRTAREAGLHVVALHVHHGLFADADDWLLQVRRQAQRWGAAFASRKLKTRPAAGQSVEAWARGERYRALAEMAVEAGCSIVLLAHHRRDQAETWLLQALRSGGPAGLSAMPKQAQRQGLTWARPWLDMPRETIESYVRRHRLRYVDDTSNADARFARNRLRLQVWPALLSAFPDAEKALTGAARQAQAAAALAAETAAIDLPPLLHGAALAVQPWLALTPARRRNALEAWLQQRLLDVPHSLLDRLLLELPPQRNARWPTPEGELRLFRGLLAAGVVVPPEEPPAPLAVDLHQPGCVALPTWHGSFEVTHVQQGGAPPALLQSLLARVRAGGEQFALAPAACARSLKKQFQARAVPVWQRAGPLLFTANGRLLFVPGLGINATLWAARGQPQLGLRWLPQPGR